MTNSSHQVRPFRSQDPRHVRAGYAVLAALLFVALAGFAAGFLT